MEGMPEIPGAVSSENRRKFEPTPRRRRARSVSNTTAARRCSGVFFRSRRVSNASGRSRLTLGVRAFGRALENGESLANTGLLRVRVAERERCRTPPRAASAERQRCAGCAGRCAGHKKRPKTRMNTGFSGKYRTNKADSLHASPRRLSAFILYKYAIYA